MSDVIFVPLTQGRVAAIDADDFEKMQGFTWYVQKQRRGCYAQGYLRGSKIGGAKPVFVYLHRLILKAPEGKQVDHIDGDGLNNRRSNLRLCSHAENLRALCRKRAGATSRYRGVFKQASMWLVKIRTEGRQKYLGCFKSEEDAARAYDAAARELFGEFASLNFPA